MTPERAKTEPCPSAPPSTAKSTPSSSTAAAPSPPTDQITLPPRTHQAVEATVIENHMIAIKSLNPEKAVRQAHELWTTMPDSRDYLTEEKTTALMANFQFPHIRDQLIL